MTEQADMHEMAVASGYAMARSDKYRRQRLAERARQHRALYGSRASGANVPGWTQLARLMEDSAGSRAPLGAVVHGGSSLLQ